MPSQVRQVAFSPIPATYSRLPHDDEHFVMRAFAKHSASCNSGCAHPYATHRSGSTLCPKGHQRALDVAQYVFVKAGLAFSVVDLNNNQRMQVEIPPDCAPVRELLKAMDRGLRLRQQQQKPPVVSYDRNYYVPPRRQKTRDLEADLEYWEPSSSSKAKEPRYETVEPKHHHHSHSHHHHSSSPSSGSKHHHHHHHKEGRTSSGAQRHPTFYTIGSRGALPVPRGDEGWYY